MRKPIVSFLDFQKLDLLVGEVKKAAVVEGSRNLIAMGVDLGAEYGKVEIMAGIGGYYKPINLAGKKFIFVANLEPKKMLGRFSNGMILAANIEGKPVIIPIPKKIPNGTTIR